MRKLRQKEATQLCTQLISGRIRITLRQPDSPASALKYQATLAHGRCSTEYLYIENFFKVLPYSRTRNSLEDHPIYENKQMKPGTKTNSFPVFSVRDNLIRI